jgi:hypothetical protein
MQRKTKIASIVAALTLVTGGLAIGAPSAGGSIYACLSASAGTLTKVSTKAPKCPKGTTLISWDRVGPVGARGPAGTKGADGEDGERGERGPKGGAELELTRLEDSRGGISKITTWGNGNFVKDYGTLWPLRYVSGGNGVQVAAFYDENEVSLWKSTGCEGEAEFAALHPRTRITEWLPYSTKPSDPFYPNEPWLDTFPNLPLEGEPHLINNRLVRVVFDPDATYSQDLSDYESFEWFDYDYGRVVCVSGNPDEFISSSGKTIAPVDQLQLTAGWAPQLELQKPIFRLSPLGDGSLLDADGN